MRPSVYGTFSPLVKYEEYLVKHPGKIFPQALNQLVAGMMSSGGMSG